MQVKPNQIADIIKKEIESYEGKYEFTEAGSVIQVGDGIARVSGLQNAMSGELLEFSNGTYGMAQNLDQDSIGVIIMGSDAGIKEGDPVKLTGRMADVPVGDAMLGRVVNALGEPIDDNGPITTDKFRLIESEAPTVIERGEVNNPLHTGIKAIDALVPIGKGQRELIIGDRETGKTTIAIDSILNQKGKDVHCIYVAIGQKSSTLARIIRILTEAGAMEYTTIVFSAANESAAMQYFTPYSGTAMAEEWMHQGKDVLIVYDDLSKHAVAYRAISLLLGRPPGREAYPGDIFYLHSRLLERSGQLSDEQGGGSITALPIVETQGGDISAYVPTNIISITDGQIYLESELFNHGIRPAINPGLSVSRVGGSAQIDAMKNLAGPLRIEFAQYNELSVFAQFGTDLDENTLDRLNHGEKIQEILKQPQHRPLAIEEQVLMLYALNNGYLDDIETNRVLRFQREFLRYVEIHASEILEEIAKTGKLSEELATRIDQLIVDVKAEYSYK
ncbi:MAG: F0F1 ATP synthase subunit alpha [Clostridiaceae bacterium]|nr:F0F1 ATP synthase subunit alpha [Clostridiaceae bacterium]